VNLAPALVILKMMRRAVGRGLLTILNGGNLKKFNKFEQFKVIKTRRIQFFNFLVFHWK